MLLRIGGPYNGYRNGEVIELDDEEGQELYDKLGGEPRVSVLGDLRGPDGPTKEELYAEAQELDIHGRTGMDKQQLADAIEAAKAAPPTDDD